LPPTRLENALSFVGYFQSRLQFGVQLQLCDLIRLPSMLSHTARLLYDAGLTNVSAVATASPENIEVLLKNACPFKSAKETEEAEKLGETDVDVHALVSEARKILQLELEKLRTSLVPLDILNSIEKNLSANLSDVGCRNSPKASTPILKESPILQNILTPPAKIKSTMKENLKPANITPDMFAESSIDSSQSIAESLHRSPKNQGVIQIPPRTPLTKAAEILQSLRLSDDELFDTIRNPPFSACAEKLASVTEKPFPKCSKRRVSVEDVSFLDATPPNQHSIGKRSFAFFSFCQCWSEMGNCLVVIRF
jgi:hypothetical protein